METLSQLPLEDQRKLKEKLARLHEKNEIGLDQIVLYSNNGAVYLIAYCPFENPIDDFWHVVCGKMMIKADEETGEYVLCDGFPFFTKSPISGVEIPQFVKGRHAVLELIDKTKLFDFSLGEYIDQDLAPYKGTVSSVEYVRTIVPNGWSGTGCSQPDMFKFTFDDGTEKIVDVDIWYLPDMNAVYRRFFGKASNICYNPNEAYFMYLAAMPEQKRPYFWYSKEALDELLPWSKGIDERIDKLMKSQHKFHMDVLNNNLCGIGLDLEEIKQLLPPELLDGE